MAIAEKELVAKKGVAAETDLVTLAKPYADSFAASIERHTQAYLAHVEEARAKAKTGAGLVDPDIPVPGLPTYPWWNLVMAGPFQPITGPGGPFLANRIIKAGEPAFMLGAIWRNPAGIYWNVFSPNAVTMMSTMAMSVQFQTLDLTTGTPGPVIVPAGIPTPLGFTNPIVFIAPLAFAVPADGKPHLYEINLVADSTNPGMPFAGYSTWQVNPDTEPPFLGLPPAPAGLLHDIPARVLVYAS